MSPKVIISFLIIIFLSVFSTPLKSQPTTIEQKLSLVTDDNHPGGNLVFDVQVKGTSLTSANTLGSATIDVQFDNTKLSYQSADTWAFGAGLGYDRSATNNITFIRVGVTGGAVGPSQGTSGFDIGTSYIAWVRLHFLITSDGITNLTIDSGTNQIGLFENHANDPDTPPAPGAGVINDQTLTAPDVIEATNVPLPVELSSFNAKAKGSDVELLWKTATEVNNFGFDIERKYESKNNWEKIGSVAGNGNSNSEKVYSFIDNSISSAGKYFYRLKQIDINGYFKYSAETFAELLKPGSYKLNQNFPNPFNPETKISFSIKDAGNVNLTIYNVLGEEVRTILNEFKEAGSYTLNFNAAELNSGVYFYRLQTNNYSEIKKMIVLK